MGDYRIIVNRKPLKVFAKTNIIYVEMLDYEKAGSNNASDMRKAICRIGESMFLY